MSLISERGFGDADIPSAFVLPGCTAADIEGCVRNSPHCDLRKASPRGETKVIVKTDCLPFTTTASKKGASYYCNRSPSQLVWNYENMAFGQPVKDRSLSMYKAVFGVRENLVAQIQAGGFSADLPGKWGSVYPRFPHRAQ